MLHLPEIKLVGIKVRTNNASEMNPTTGKIGPLVSRYHQEGISQKIKNCKNPGAIFGAYADYEDEIIGDYTYFIGQEVMNFDEVPQGLDRLTIPPQMYTKFTNGPGPMPGVCVALWQKIWQMSSQELGGERAYQTDFELYDERAQDPQNTILDIYIGLKG